MELSWLANPRTIRFLQEIVNQFRPSLIFLSETLVKQQKVNSVCKLIHFVSCFVIDAQGHGGGVGLMWKNEGGIIFKGSSKHFMDFEVACEQVGWWQYTGFYGCPERERRRESSGLIRELASRSKLPWCIIGDFNDMMFAHEKVGGVGIRGFCWKVFLRLLMSVV